MTNPRSRLRDPEKAAYWSDRIAEWKSSGLSVIAFCRKERLNRYRFYYWRKTLRSGPSKASETSPKPSFASLHVKTPVFIEHAGLRRDEIEISLLKKYTIKLRTDIDPQSLKSILHILETASC